MDIRCRKCNQKYHLPDNQVDDKRVYFFCENCGHRIVIDRKRDSWFSYTSLTDTVLHAGDIMEGLYHSFNLKNFLASFILLVSLSLIFSLASLIGTSNLEFFATHLFISGLLVLVLATLFLWSFDIHLYLISKNLLYRISHGKNIRFSGMGNAILQDMPSLFTVSVGLPLFFILVFLPVYLLKNEYGAVYAGFFHGIFLVAAFCIMLVWYCKNMVMAFIALRPRFLRNNIGTFFRFCRVENINIPAYLLINGIITLFFATVIFSIFAGALGLALMAMGTAVPSLMPQITGLLGPLTGGGTALPAMDAEWADSMRTGMVLAGFWTYLALLIAISYLINLVQSLSTVSVKIMESNPGRSIGRNAMLIGLLVAVAVLLLVAGKF